MLARLDPARRAGFTRLLRWAQGIAPVREDALADIGLGWPQLRRMLRELGGRLVAAGTIDRPDDVFWLRRDEVLGEQGASLAERRRGAEGRLAGPAAGDTRRRCCRRARWWERFESLMPAASTEQTGSVLRGTGASAGQVTAPARVLAGPEDFGRMQPGDVLVASITTPAWTSLFAMASGVVTDVGGPLSHSSIVAREYGIPAVLGTAVATRRITDGARIRVDGDAGTVTLLDGAEEEPPAPPAADQPAFHYGEAAIAVAVAGVAAWGLARWRGRRSRTRES